MHIEKHYDDIRAEVRASGWQKISDAFGHSLADAFAELYTLYTPDIVDWYAGLYDAKTGGYYYSASARDNEKTVYCGKEYTLLPDAESTCQALGFWSSSGMAARGNNNYYEVIPSWMRDDIVAFIRGLQDPDGYYYHPQWGKDIHNARRGRDYMWCTSMLKSMGAEPRYSSIADSSKKEAENKPLIPDYLQSRQAFLGYAEKLFAEKSSWSAGNEIAAQVTIIGAAGLLDTAVEFMNSKQLSENGCWEPGTGYSAVNGLLKISAVYNHAKKPLPNALAGAKAAIGCIVSDDEIHCVCDLYNTWYTISNITGNLRRYGGEEGERAAENIVAELRELAPYAIRRSKEKIAPHKKESGSFSYYRGCPCPTSQSAVVAVANLPEGDGNATNISTVGLTNFIYSALGLVEYKVPILIPEDGDRYAELLEAKKKSV